MTQRVIAVYSGKGGVGKSTIGALLAVATGDSTVVDCDPQASLAHWSDIRERAPEVLTIPPSRLKSQLSKIKSKYVIVDTPGALVTGTIDALKLCDLILVVTPIDTFELAALNDTLNTAEIANVPIALVINRLHPQTKAESALSLVSELGIPVCPTIIRERAVHKHALIDGETCFEQGGESAARHEATALWEWILSLLTDHSSVA